MIKLRILLFIISIFCILPLLAQNQEQARLKNLLMERAELFDQYKESINSKSGIFGLRSKADIKESNEVLISIIKMDNKIINELEVMYDTKAFEQRNLGQKTQEVESTLGQQFESVQKKTEELLQMQEKLKKEKTKRVRYAFLFWILVVVNLAALYLWIKRRYL